MTQRGGLRSDFLAPPRINHVQKVAALRPQHLEASPLVRASGRSRLVCPKQPVGGPHVDPDYDTEPVMAYANDPDFAA